MIADALLNAHEGLQGEYEHIPSLENLDVHPRDLSSNEALEAGIVPKVLNFDRCAKLQED